HSLLACNESTTCFCRLFSNEKHLSMCVSSFFETCCWLLFALNRIFRTQLVFSETASQTYPLEVVGLKAVLAIPLLNADIGITEQYVGSAI
uniref:Ovule protein n=1 Tax=Ascaris lumbricoides TaxID=6252 RepID=A0A0M3I8W5_ASCLU